MKKKRRRRTLSTVALSSFIHFLFTYSFPQLSQASNNHYPPLLNYTIPMEKKACQNTTRKPIRRSQATRSSQAHLGDVETRREIANALLHHRASSSSLPAVSSSAPSRPPCPWGDCRVPTLATDWCNHGMIGTSNYGLENIKCSRNSSSLPEPTWSTTAPASRQPTSPTMEVPEFQWGSENQDSSYTWWLGFLKSLDDEIKNEKSVYPSDEDIEMEYFRQLFISLFKTDPNQIDPPLDNQNSAPDEWLTVPEVENHSDLSDS